MFRLLRSRKSAAVLIAASIAVTSAACAPSNNNANNSAGGEKDVNVIVVSGPLDDPFFSALKRGTDDAAKQLGVTTQYLSPSSSKEGSGPTLARLIRDAINKKPDAMVVANFFPDAENPVIKEAADAGIPVIVHNTGADNWQELGALAYVGLEAGPVGKEAAKEMGARNVDKVLCVNPVPGNPFLEQACGGLEAGMKEQGKSTATITIPYADSTNPTKVTQAIEGALKADQSIGGVFVFGSAVAQNARTASDNVGRKITIGTGDVSTQVLKDIQSGSMAFALDSQPYLQSYYSVQMAAQYVRYGIAPVGTILTGPRAITKDNVADVIKVNEESKGIRGAS